MAVRINPVYLLKDRDISGVEVEQAFTQMILMRCVLIIFAMGFQDIRENSRKLVGAYSVRRVQDVSKRKIQLFKRWKKRKDTQLVLPREQNGVLNTHNHFQLTRVLAMPHVTS